MPEKSRACNWKEIGNVSSENVIEDGLNQVVGPAIVFHLPGVKPGISSTVVIPLERPAKSEILLRSQMTERFARILECTIEYVGK